MSLIDETKLLKTQRNQRDADSWGCELGSHCIYIGTVIFRKAKAFPVNLQHTGVIK